MLVAPLNRRFELGMLGFFDEWCFLPKTQISDGLSDVFKAKIRPFVCVFEWHMQSAVGHADVSF